MLIDQIAQYGIAVPGLVALYLAGSTSTKDRRRAGIFGLISEPFWFATAIINHQPGVMVLATFYAFFWWRMVRNNSEKSNRGKPVKKHISSKPKKKAPTGHGRHQPGTGGTKDKSRTDRR